VCVKAIAMDSLVSRPQRRRRQREIMLQNEEEDEYYDMYEEEEMEVPATNDFASLEAMLASQASGGDARHGFEKYQQDPMQLLEEHDHQHEHEGANASILPSSPSTLSNDSIVSPQKIQAQVHNERVYETKGQHKRNKNAMPAPIPKKIPPKQPEKKKPMVAHTAKSIVGSRYE